MNTSASTSTRRCRRTRREINEGGTAGAGGPSLVCRGLRPAADSGTPFFCKGMCGCQRRDGGIIAILPLMAHSVMRAWLKMRSWGNRPFLYGAGYELLWHRGHSMDRERARLHAIPADSNENAQDQNAWGELPALPGRDPGRHLVWPGLHPLLLRRESRAGAALRRTPPIRTGPGKDRFPQKNPRMSKRMAA